MIVIADDITGAAEIAGLAFQQGFRTHLTIGMNGEMPYCDVLVVVTDTRSMTEQEAVNATRNIISHFVSPSNGGGQGRALLFKKTDSALRGHVVAELSAAMQTGGYRRAVYLPANPNRGRIVSGGVYFVGGVPLHQTDFSFDPEFPAFTSVLGERFPDAAGCHILMPDAETMADIERIVEEYNDGHTLFAGAADLFTCLLKTVPSSSLSSDVGRCDCPSHASAISAIVPSSAFPVLFLCGSTQSVPLDIGLPVCPMPLSVYQGEEKPDRWLETAQTAYLSGPGVMLTIPHHHLTGRDIAVQCRQAMACVAAHLIKKQPPRRLIIEGGATAFSCLSAIGWQQFRVTNVLAPGVVAMDTPNTTTVVLKPGSYPWPDNLTC